MWISDAFQGSKGWQTSFLEKKQQLPTYKQEAVHCENKQAAASSDCWHLVVQEQWTHGIEANIWEVEGSGNMDEAI